jgi:hypothetical protein
MSIVLILAGAVLAWLTYVAYKGEWLITLFVFLAILFGVVSCTQSDWWTKHQAEERKAAYAEAIANQKPRLVSEADGCKVYTFKGGDRWQYFTRCGATTTTDNSYKESCGKNCSRVVPVAITTEAK